MKKKKDIRTIISRTMIIVGAVLVVFGVGYEAVNYPWRILLAKMGFSVSQELKDPPPVGTMGTADQGGEIEEDVAVSGKLYATRPNIEVTQLGIIKLPKIGIAENIVEGSGEGEMLWGVGHVRGTAMPGEKGNCVLAGHRNYIIMHPFRHLDKIELGDTFTIKVGETVYTYEVFKTFQIEPDDKWILQPSEEEDYLVTLLTCTPVLNPTHRLIVWGKQIDPVPVSSEEKTPQESEISKEGSSQAGDEL